MSDKSRNLRDWGVGFRDIRVSVGKRYWLASGIEGRGKLTITPEWVAKLVGRPVSGRPGTGGARLGSVAETVFARRRDTEECGHNTANRYRYLFDTGILWTSERQHLVPGGGRDSCLGRLDPPNAPGVVRGSARHAWT